MAIEADGEILQDFLIESSEILEQLSEQLVDLESKPEDKELLNAIFRGFHTVKGGAGFLALHGLVNVCHAAENIFDLLRQGKKKINSELMDVVLTTLDVVNNMFNAIKNNQDIGAADPKLITQLKSLAENKPSAKVEEKPQKPIKPVIKTEENKEEKIIEPNFGDDPEIQEIKQHGIKNEITEDEFEQLLDDIESKAKGQVLEETNNDLITEEEFEKLISGIAGKQEDVVSIEAVAQPTQPPILPSTAPQETTLANNNDDLMTETEFDNLLNEIAIADAKHINLDTVNIKNEAIASATVNEQLEKKHDEQFEKILVDLHPKQAASEVHETRETVEAIGEATGEAAGDGVSGIKERTLTAEKKLNKEVTLAAETTVRVNTDTLDEIMNMVGELVLVRNRLVKLRTSNTDAELAKAVGNLDVVTSDLQMSVMKTRMQPIKKVFGRFPRVVRDLARGLKKEVILEMEGEETDLDKNLVEALSDPLVHLVRNAVDHGIESPESRVSSGKDRTGHIKLAASQAGDHIILSISDDGKGMDADELRKVAVEKGLFDVDAAKRLSQEDCFNLIFMPGFSTKKEISDISGRGVGMDVVKTKISQLNGTIDIDSVKGRGSKIIIKVPLTLAILPTLMVEVATHPYALPLTSVSEIFHLDLKKTNIVDGQLVVIVRGKTAPLFYLRDWLANKSGRNNNTGHVVVVNVGTQRVGLVVDSLLGQEEVVIKALGEMIQGTAGMAGATITGDGKIAIILDIPSLLNCYAKKSN